jgi:enoyl-CoA hydratase
MIFESRHISVTVDHGTATLAFGSPGEPGNALGLVQLREFDAALDAVATSRGFDVLVVRSAIPNCFCAGLCPAARHSLMHPADRAAFAWYGQQVLEKLAQLEAVSIAFIDGVCLGVGFELALACDHRLCVAHPTTPLGFPERFACFGGSSRVKTLCGRSGMELLTSGRVISAREAVRLGLVDDACSQRRAKIALRGLLDRIEARPIKSSRYVNAKGLAEERRAFSVATIPPLAEPAMFGKSDDHAPPFPGTIGLLGNDASVETFASAVALQGASVIVCGDRSGIFSRIAESERRGFITRLEAEQVRLRVRAADTLDGFRSAEMVFVAEPHNPFRLAAVVRPRAVVCIVRTAGGDPSTSQSPLAVPFPFPRRLIHINFCGTDRVALFPDAATGPETLSAFKTWLRPYGYASVVFPVAARLLPRAA